MTQRLHETPWRQGHVIADDTARALNLLHSEYPGETAVVVISHDCDLAAAASAEPFCEVIIGRKIQDQDGSFTRAKSVRKLHLNFTGGCVACVIEMESQRKRLIPRVNLDNHAPSDSIMMNEDQKTTLQAWIAARYARASFPTEFDTRLTKQANKSYRKIVKVIERNDAHLRAVYFDVDDTEREGPKDVYPLTIFLVYDVEMDAIKSKTEVEKAASEITAIFDKEFKQNGIWSNIELVACRPISENAMSMRAARYAKRWHVDYISLAK